MKQLVKKKYLDNAINFSKEILNNFKDKKNGGYFINSKKTNDIFIKLKSIYNTSTPSGISVIIESFAKLFFLTGENIYFEEAEQALKSVTGNIIKNFFNSASLINSYDLLKNGIYIVLIKKNETSILNNIKKKFLPNMVYQEIKDSKKLPKKNIVANKKILNDKTTVFICRKQTCSKGITTLNELNKILE